MRILVSCDRYPWPLDNGQNLRIWHYVRALRERHEFDLVCFGEPPVPPELAELFGRITVFPRPVHDAAAPWSERLRDRLDYRRMIPASQPARQHFAAVADQYDLVWMSGWDTLTSLPLPLACAWLADAVDDGLLEYERELRSSAPWRRKLRVARRWLKVWLVQRELFGRADVCALVSEVDAASFAASCPGVPVLTLPNGVDADYFAPLGLAPELDTLVFEGRMDFRPNVDAACWLATEILPRVRSMHPGARLVLVGNQPAPAVSALANEAVQVTGWVEDVRPYLDRAALFVAPMRLGAGIKNKVLQAWSMGKAVVATSEATGGLRAEPGVNLELADGAEALATAIVALLADPVRRQALGRAARATVDEHYTWARRAEDLEAAFELAVRRRHEVAYA